MEAIWSQENDSDVIYCTGDLVDYGPFPKEVLDWTRDHDVICTQGNHDRWVAICYRAGNTLNTVNEQGRSWVHHNAGLLNEDEVGYLEALPQALTFELDQKSYGLTHLYHEYEEIVSLHGYLQFCQETFPMLPNPAQSRIILGHTHRQAVRYLSDEALWLNPGSASYRRQDDPDQAAHYATITDGVISLRRLIYNIEPLRFAVEQVSLKDSEMRAARRFFRSK